MSYYDKKFGNLFPTRTGTPTGGANERQMLARQGGSEGYRKEFRVGPDGTVTMLATKNGMPQFSTIPSAQDAPVLDTPIYLETGQLAGFGTGGADPTRYITAKWNFLDILPTNNYLGWAKSTGDQKNYAPLVEDQESQAVGYPKVYLDNNSTPTQIAEAAATDAAQAAALKDDLLLRKLVISYFPPSLFSGKMRLYMQALYGSRVGTYPYPLSIEVLGTSILLKYNNVQLGVSEGKTPGIFTASDGTFWMLDITMSAGSVYGTYYPVIISTNAAAMVKRYKTETLSSLEKSKLEAYIFANSYIDMNSPRSMGIVTGAQGGAMAYGWKFNTSGNKARIVVHKVLNAGTSTARWVSSTVELNFAYSSGVISMGSSVTQHGEWIDGWGEFNIFVPESSTSTAPLTLYSLKAAGSAVSFSFSAIPIYGYFKDDTWVDVNLTNVISSGPFPIFTHSASGLEFGPLTDQSASEFYVYGRHPANASIAYESHNTTAQTTMTLSGGGVTYIGANKYGTHTYITKGPGGGGSVLADASNFVAYYFGPGSGDPALQTPPPGFPVLNSAVPVGNPMVQTRIAWENWSFTGLEVDSWALAIPGGDCEAFNVAKKKYTSSGAYTHTKKTQLAFTRFYGTNTTGDNYDFYPWLLGSTIGDGSPVTSTSTTDSDAPAFGSASVDCHNTAGPRTNLVPGGSLTPMFEVSYTYPYYPRGMFTYTSYGKRYKFSEGAGGGDASPPSVDQAGRFVGWA